MLQPLQYNSKKYTRVYLFRSYLVYKIKMKTTDKPYKKSCFMVQDYNNIEQIVVLTQMPTI